MKIVLVHNLTSNHEDDTSIVDRLAIAPQVLWSSETRTEFAAILEDQHPDVAHMHNTFMVTSSGVMQLDVIWCLPNILARCLGFIVTKLVEFPALRLRDRLLP